MAILIADTKLETETDAWYQFYVDKMSDIADLPTSQSTGASYKVKRLARPTSIAYCIEMAAVYVLDGADQWRLMSRDSATEARAAEGNTLNYMNRTLDIANQAAGSASSTNFAFGPDADGRFSFFIRRSS